MTSKLQMPTISQKEMFLKKGLPASKQSINSLTYSLTFLNEIAKEMYLIKQVKGRCFVILAGALSSTPLWLASCPSGRYILGSVSVFSSL